MGCRDSNKIPLLISNQNNLENRTKCISVTHHESYPAFQFTTLLARKNYDTKEYDLDYDFFEMMSETIEKYTQMKLTTSEIYKYTKVELATSKFYDEQICIPEFRQELNCKEYNGSKYSCATCADGFYMDNLVNCVKGVIPNCQAYEDEYHCNKCGQGYYVTGAETSLTSGHIFIKGCKEYTVDCQQYSLDKDSCIRCKPGAYMDTTAATEKYDCKPYTVPNCAVYSHSSDVCRICEPGAYLDSSGKCKPINVVNCIIYSKSGGSCLACMNGFYLEKGTSLCKAHSILNCEVFGLHTDSCDMCSENYYLDDLNKRCLQLTLDGCASARRNKNECLFCKNGYYLDKSIEKCRLNTALYCQFKSNIANKCVTCVSTAYLDKTNPNDLKCRPYRIAKNCTHFDAFEDKCKGCQPGFYHSNGPAWNTLFPIVKHISTTPTSAQLVNTLSI